MAGHIDGTAARDRAARAARARIDADLARARPGVGAALRHLRDNLFESDLTSGDLQEASGIGDSSFFHAFHDATGERPKAYLEILRLETAASLLRDTRVTVGHVATLCGFVSLKTFRTRFRRRFGIAPGRFARERAEDEPAPTGGAVRVEAPHWYDAFVRWAAAETRDRESGAMDEAAVAESARARAERAWSVARRLTARGRDALVVMVATTTPALVELLFTRSRIEGRGDRAWGVEVGELALRAIPEHTNPAWPAALRTEMRVRAHAWLGNAHRLRLDFTPATEAFATARRILESSQEPVSDYARCELPWLEAGLYWVRTNYARAAILADEAVALAEDEISDAHPLLVPALRRRASIAADAGRVAESISDLERCLALADPASITPDRALLHQAIAQRYLLVEDAAGAARALALGERMARALDDSWVTPFMALARGRLEWLRGEHIKAVDTLEKALQAFEAQDSRFDIIVTMTDLALVRLEAGDTTKATDIVDRLLPALRLLNAGAEWRRLIQEVRSSLVRRDLAIAVLGKVKAALPAYAARGFSAQLPSEA